MSIAIAVFVKTPGHSNFKTRLAKDLGLELTHSFYLACLQTLQSTLQTCVKNNPNITPYWAVAEEEAKNDELWQNFKVITQGSGSLGERLITVEKKLLESHDAIIFLGADCPQISAQTIEQAVQEIKTQDHKAVLGKAADGGFYLYGNSKALSELWLDVPYSHSNTAEKLIAALKNNQQSLLRLPVLTDVDQIEDLKALTTELQISDNNLKESKPIQTWLDVFLRTKYHC